MTTNGRTTRVALLLTLGTLLLLAGFPATRATEELGRTEQLRCVACHDKAGSKLLTSKGKYFELVRSFDGYDSVMRRYRKCTACHAKFPGSLKLTRRGEYMLQRGLTMEHVSGIESLERRHDPPKPHTPEARDR